MNGQEFYCAATAYHEARGEPLDGQDSRECRVIPFMGLNIF